MRPGCLILTVTTLRPSIKARRLFGCSQGTDVPRQESASQIIDPETDAPTSICQRIRLLPARQWSTENTQATGTAIRTPEEPNRAPRLIPVRIHRLNESYAI